MSDSEFLATLEKAWHHSKKFLAFLLMEIFLCALVVYILYVTRVLEWAHASVLIVVVFSMTSIALAFNTTQAKQDIYTRGMALLGGGVPEKLKEQIFKDIGLGKKEAPPVKEKLL
jgi:Kef-type K+ transport system membrane component KefB